MNKKNSIQKTNIIATLSPADIITLLNAVAGFLSIYFSSSGKFLEASILLFAAVLFDFLDGRVARITKKLSILGADLDSLADALSFAVAPAFLIINYTNSKLSIILGIILVLCAILRLARFNARPIEKAYEGLPVTINGIIFPLTLIIYLYFFNFPHIIFYILLLLSSILMISSLKIRKL